MDKLLVELEELIRRLRDEHVQLLGLIRRKTQALRLAKPEVVGDCCERENQAIQRIGALEKRRQALVGQITSVLNPGAAAPMRLSEIAAKASPTRADRLKVLHAELRQLIEQVRCEGAIAQRATQGLLQHVQGVMQNLRQRFAGGNIYGRRGVASGPSEMVSSFSMTG